VFGVWVYWLLALQVHHLRPELASLGAQCSETSDACEAVLFVAWFGLVLLITVLALATSLLERSKPLLTVLRSGVLVDVSQARAGEGTLRTLEALIGMLGGDVVLEEVIALMCRATLVALETWRRLWGCLLGLRRLWGCLLGLRRLHRRRGRGKERPTEFDALG